MLISKIVKGKYCQYLYSMVFFSKGQFPTKLTAFLEQL